MSLHNFKNSCFFFCLNRRYCVTSTRLSIVSYGLEFFSYQLHVWNGTPDAVQCSLVVCQIAVLTSARESERKRRNARSGGASVDSPDYCLSSCERPIRFLPHGPPSLQLQAIRPTDRSSFWIFSVHVVIFYPSPLRSVCSIIGGAIISGEIEWNLIWKSAIVLSKKKVVSTAE